MAKLLKRMQAKVSGKKKRLKHAQNFVNTVDQKGKHLLCDSVTGYLLSVAIHQYAGHKTCPCCVILS